MQQLAGNNGRFFGWDGRFKSLLENRGLRPGKRMQRDIGHAIPLLGKRKLPHHRDRVPQHILLTKTGKPEAERKLIGHGALLLADDHRTPMDARCHYPQLYRTGSRPRGGSWELRIQFPRRTTEKTFGTFSTDAQQVLTGLVLACTIEKGLLTGLPTTSVPVV